MQKEAVSQPFAFIFNEFVWTVLLVTNEILHILVGILNANF